MKDFTMRDIIYLIIITCLIIGFSKCCKTKEIIEPNIKIDTTYNRTIIDSIKYNIVKQDSIIKKIKYDIEYKVQEALSADDSTTIILFQKLVTR